MNRTAVIGLALALLVWLVAIYWNDPTAARPTEVHFKEPEKWTAAMTEQGGGRIRYSDPQNEVGRDSDSDTSAAAPSIDVPSAGPLSSDGLRWCLRTCEGFVSEADKKLENSNTGGGEDKVRIAYRQCEALQVLYLYKTVEELLRKGSYITYLPDNVPPPCPKGCTYVEMAGMPLQGGGTANVVVWVDLMRRRELTDAFQLLAETRQAARWERLKEWNSRPETERRAEINDYLVLSQKAMQDPTRNLSADELVRYWRLHAVLLELNAEAVHGRDMIFERQGAARR